MNAPPCARQCWEPVEDAEGREVGWCYVRSSAHCGHRWNRKAQRWEWLNQPGPASERTAAQQHLPEAKQAAHHD